jgi:hypothetical protein
MMHQQCPSTDLVLICPADPEASREEGKGHVWRRLLKRRQQQQQQWQWQWQAGGAAGEVSPRSISSSVLAATAGASTAAWHDTWAQHLGGRRGRRQRDRWGGQVSPAGQGATQLLRMAGRHCSVGLQQPGVCGKHWWRWRALPCSRWAAGAWCRRFCCRAGPVAAGGWGSAQGPIGLAAGGVARVQAGAGGWIGCRMRTATGPALGCVIRWQCIS